MNSFLIRRLIPFLLSYFFIELIAATYLGISNINNVDWKFKTILQDMGVLQLTSLVSFLFMIIPYVCYLTILPQKYQNSKTDKIITIIIFAAFLFSNIMENFSGIIFWNELNILKNTPPTQYVAKAQEILLEIYATYPLWLLISITLILSGIITFAVKPLLFTKISEPALGRRIFHFILYALVCFLAFINIDIEKLNNDKNPYNSRISEDKTYFLLNGFVKKHSRLMILRNYPNKNNKLEHHNDN